MNTQTKEEKLELLKQLVSQFKANIKQYKSQNYDEANTRVDFIDKFFELLDWDVRNIQGFAEQYREVVREDRVQIEGKAKAPDYSFRIGGIRKFFVEAKKPLVYIKEEIDPAYQVRRYGYTAKLPLSILTDFEEFAIYDTRIKPNKNDKADVARIFYCTYEKYEKYFDFIYGTFSKTAILKGSFDRYVEENKNKKGSSEVDSEILKTIEEWRTELAKNIALRNSDIDIYNLNTAVQRIIDRIMFLRIAEDKDIEKYENLLKATETKDVYKNLNKLFIKANDKYNSSLFKEEKWLSDLIIDDKVLVSIVKGLYYPDCPYEFSILPVEILGNIYEQFLGKTIKFRNVKGGHTAIVEEKPEVRKSGGVYYTPRFIVNYIVENTVGEKIRGKNPEEISKIKICDPACGSGSFLVDAYQYLLNYHLAYYTDEKNIKKALKEGKIYQIGENSYKLTIEEKQRILVNNIYGVDIDPQAVEVAKFSLYLKLLENENKEAEGYLFKHTDLKLLPSLEDNIKCGNSLIGSDFYKDKDVSLFDKNEMRKINAFDWEKEFPNVFKKKEKEVKAFHVIWATHNSRISDRMIEYKVKTGDPFIFSDEEEIKISEIINNIAKQEKYKILAYNICKDHIHMLIVCEPSELTNIVKVIKGKSSFLFKKYLNIENNEKFHLWTQKFYAKEISEENMLINTINYIINNRLKHELQDYDDNNDSDNQDKNSRNIGYSRYIDNSVDNEHSDHSGHSAHTEHSKDSRDGEGSKRHTETETETETDNNNKGLKPLVISTLSTSSTSSTSPATHTIHTSLSTPTSTPLSTTIPISTSPTHSSRALATIIQEMTCSYEEAFSQYEKDGFDVVIGNPPYGAELNNEERKYLDDKYHLNNTDTACLFIGQALRILKKDGFIGYIIPKPFIYASNWEAIRKEVLNILREIVDCGKVWKEVKLEQTILILDLQKNLSQYKSSIRKDKEIKTIGYIQKSTFYKFGFYLNGISEEELKVGKKILNIGSFLNDYCINRRGSMHQKEITDNPSDFKVLGGKQINRYYLTDNIKGYISKENIQDEKAYINENSILVQNIVAHIENPTPHIKIIGTIPKNIDREKYIILDTVNQLINVSDVKSEIILGILNSKLISWYAYGFIFGFAIRTMHFDNSVTSKIPMPKREILTSNNATPLTSLVDQMLEAQKLYHNAKTENDKKVYKQKIEIIDKQIDNLVYKLYDLTDEEIKIIENTK